MIDYNIVEKEVFEILKHDKSGHSTEHVFSVVNHAKKILAKIDNVENINKDVVLLSCLLHECDDYKIFGHEYSQKLINTNKILDKLDISETLKNEILDIMDNMGYSKYLKGVRPKSIEGQIVSDADMLELGSTAIVRTLNFGFSRNRPVFDVDQLPQKELQIDKYQAKEEHSINHFFDKILLIKDIMFTEPAKEIAEKRQKVLVDFLDDFFEYNYQDCSKWQELLQKYK